MKNGYYIFYYHDISSNIIIPNNIKTSLERFKSEISYIKNNFQIFSLKDGIKYVLENKKLTNRIASICFDDGFDSVLKNVMPVLEKEKIKSTIFVCESCLKDKDHWLDSIIIYNLFRKKKLRELETRYNYQFKSDNLGNFLRLYSNKNLTLMLTKLRKKYLKKKKIYLSFNDLNKLNPELFDIGSHTKNHFYLNNLSLAEQKKEVHCSGIMKRKNYVDILAIPYGDRGSYNNDTLSIIQQKFFNIILTGSGGINHKLNLKQPIFERIALNNNKKSIEIHIQERLKSRKFNNFLSRLFSRINY